MLAANYDAPHADYEFLGHPLSHKTIGWNGNGGLALSWSKNGEGIRRTEFTSDMVIVMTRRPTRRSARWSDLTAGCYIVPRPWLSQNVVLGSNNKTDALITSEDTARALRYSREAGLFLPLCYDHATGGGRRLSFWKAGDAAIVSE